MVHIEEMLLSHIFHIFHTIFNTIYCFILYFLFYRLNKFTLKILGNLGYSSVILGLDVLIYFLDADLRFSSIQDRAKHVFTP